MFSHPNTDGRTIHWAHLYDLGTRILGGRVRALHGSVLERAVILPGARVLDVGCGPGRLTCAAAELTGPTGEAQGIDASFEMIELATRKASRAGSVATFRVAAIEAIPSPAEHFDVVLANLVLHHLPEQLQRRGLAEVLRVLKPGGRFVIGDFRAGPGHGLGHVLSLLGLRRGSEYADHLSALLGAAGFESIHVAPAASRAFCVVSATKPPAGR